MHRSKRGVIQNINIITFVSFHKTKNKNDKFIYVLLLKEQLAITTINNVIVKSELERSVAETYDMYSHGLVFYTQRKNICKHKNCSLARVHARVRNVSFE